MSALALGARLRPGRSAAGALACGPIVHLQSVPGSRRLCGSSLFGIADTCVYRLGPLWRVLVAVVALLAAGFWIPGRPAGVGQHSGRTTLGPRGL
ncbi:hypothetical protein SUDANB121_00324 [Nocardiopsis dassonvillei]|uniref:hypothetical protein n=1 Tax=Nocardiopsis dassonvillei TaxID=2014 RepID=UPI003F576469